MLRKEFITPAKINLFLKVTGKTRENYHELESLFAFLDLADELLVEKSDKFHLEIAGDFSKYVDLKNNLFTKILDFFVTEFNISRNLKIKITKNIPVGAGLGGGSSNAAYFMKALNEIFSLQLSKEKLQEISLNFGSDIAFFFENKSSIVRGRGEIIENFSEFESIPILLVNPKIQLSTKEVFSKFSQELSGEFSEKTSNQKLQKKSIFELIENFPNDLTKAAIAKSQIIEEIINQLKKEGAKTAKMSGSGATCFAIFNNEDDLTKAQKNLISKFPNFFIRKTKIIYNV